MENDLISIERIEQKLVILRELDTGLNLFGARTHNYILNQPASEREIAEFEKLYGVTLPSGYLEFIRNVGNGGAGPYYGLEPLENTVFADLDYKNKNDLLDPSKPFPFNKLWNMDFEEIAASIDSNENNANREGIYEIYFDRKWSSGLLRICNFGCGVSLNLVVNGEEYGNIWVDDRCNDGGIYPDLSFDRAKRTNFLQWYELWLDRAILECNGSTSEK
jgi:hypothetical protein